MKYLIAIAVILMSMASVEAKTYTGQTPAKWRARTDIDVVVVDTLPAQKTLSIRKINRLISNLNSVISGYQAKIIELQAEKIALEADKVKIVTEANKVLIPTR